MTTKTLDQQTARFIASIATCFPPLSSEVMQGWIDNPQALKKFLGGLNPSGEMNSDESNFRFAVGYGLSLEQMIAAGRYDWENSNITAERFPIEGSGIVEFEARYFNFNHDISSENAIKGIEQEDTANPWMPAKIEHVLSYGATFPNEQRKFSIVGLGSVAKVDCDRFVPCLGKGGSGRDLDLGWFGDDWFAVCRFLAVRKVSAA